MSFDFSNEHIESVCDSISGISIANAVNLVNTDVYRIWPVRNFKMRYDNKSDSIIMEQPLSVLMLSFEMIFCTIAQSYYSNLLYHPRFYFIKDATHWQLPKDRTIFSKNFLVFGIKRKKPTARYTQFTNPVLVGHWVRAWLYSFYKVFTDQSACHNVYAHTRYPSKLIDNPKENVYIDTYDGLLKFLSCIVAYKEEFDKLVNALPAAHTKKAMYHLSMVSHQLIHFIEYSGNVCKVQFDRNKMINARQILPVDYCTNCLRHMISSSKKLRSEFNYNKATGEFSIPEHYYKPDNIIDVPVINEESAWLAYNAFTQEP